MSVGEKTLAAIAVIFGAATLLCIVAFLVSDWRDRRKPKAVTPAASDRFVGRATVAGGDLEWQADLARFYRDYDTYRVELRLPGERAS